MSCLLGLTVTVLATSASDRAAATGPHQYVLRTGDTVQVEGAGLGCQATRRGGRPTIECRVAGRVEKTYGTFLTERTAKVARFRSAETAQTIFTAKHRGGFRTCPGSRRSARAAAATGGSGCR
jgi:hypothetical protein